MIPSRPPKNSAKEGTLRRAFSRCMVPHFCAPATPSAPCLVASEADDCPGMDGTNGKKRCCAKRCCDTGQPSKGSPPPPDLPATYVDFSEDPTAILHPTGHSSYDLFLANNPARGTLIVQTFTAHGALPLPQTRVAVYKTIGDDHYLLFDAVTDADGLAPPMLLPTKPLMNSLSSGHAQEDYATYHVLISHAGYWVMHLYDLPIFEHQTTLQPADLIPYDGDPTDVSLTSFTEYFALESIPPDQTI